MDGEGTPSLKPEEYNWTQCFDLNAHSAHGNDPNSRIMVLSKNPQEDEIKVEQLKKKYQCTWKVVKYDPNAIDMLINKIEKEFQPTNLVLSFEHLNNVWWRHDLKRYKLTYLGQFTLKLENKKILGEVCDKEYEYSPYFMFLSLHDVYRESMGGAAYLDSRVPVTGRWKIEFDILMGNGIIPKTPFKILVLSGTHGSNKYSNSDHFKIPICGYSDERFLKSDNPKDPKYDLDKDFYKQDLKIADDLMEKHKNLTVVVKHMKHFSKAQTLVENIFGFDKKKKLRNYVLDQKPNMLIMAWCYSANCDVSMVLRSNAELSRLVLEAEMREIGISPGKANLHPRQIKVLEKAQMPGVKTMVLTGNTGSGKTVLAAEVTKVWMAEHVENHPKVSFSCFVF